MKNSIAKQVVKLGLLALIACYSQLSLAGGYYTCGSTQYATSPGKCSDGSGAVFHANISQPYQAPKPIEPYHPPKPHPIRPPKPTPKPNPPPDHPASPECKRIINLRVVDAKMNAFRNPGDGFWCMEQVIPAGSTCFYPSCE